jgi:hypothetical protein
MDFLFQIAPFVLLVFAIWALIRKFFWKKSSKSGCNSGSCGCG